MGITSTTYLLTSHIHPVVRFVEYISTRRLLHTGDNPYSVNRALVTVERISEECLSEPLGPNAGSFMDVSMVDCKCRCGVYLALRALQWGICAPIQISTSRHLRSTNNTNIETCRGSVSEGSASFACLWFLPYTYVYCSLRRAVWCLWYLLRSDHSLILSLGLTGFYFWPPALAGSQDKPHPG